jgi:thioredoxin 1
MVLEVTSVEQFDQILNDSGVEKHGKKYVLVDYFANWCRPCLAFSPTFDQLSTEYSNVYFLKVNIDTVEELAVRYQIRSIPTFMFFDVGNLKSEYEVIVGANKDKIVQRLKYFDSKTVATNAESFDF